MPSRTPDEPILLAIAHPNIMTALGDSITAGTILVLVHKRETI